MIAMVFKELGSLRVVIWFLVAITLLMYVPVLLLRPDEITFDLLCNVECIPNFANSYIILSLSAIAAVVMIYILFLREHDNKTALFLEALPISKVQVYWAKVAVMNGVVFASSALGLCVTYVLLLFNTDSVAGHFNTPFALQATLLVIVLNLVSLAYALLFVRLRFIGLIIYLTCILAIEVLRSTQHKVGQLSLFRLIEHDHFGDRLLINWSLVLAHLGVAAIVYFIAYFLWQAPAKERTTRPIATRSSQWKWPILVAIAFGIAGLVELTMNNIAGVGPWSAVRNQSDHYIFAAREDHTDKVELLLKTADKDFERLRQLLNVKDLGQPVIVDGTRSHPGNRAGAASGRKISLNFAIPKEQLRHVLNHETVHVHQYTLTQGRMTRYDPSLGFFIEGMAEYVASQLKPDDPQRIWRHRNAAVLVNRHKIRFSDLVNTSGFTNRYGIYSVYLIGEIWTNILADVCGDDILVSILSDVGNPRLNNALTGEAWWRSTLQRHNCELSLVKDTFQMQLSDIYSDYGEQGFPNLTRSGVDYDASKRRVSITFSAHVGDDPHPPSRYMLAIKQSSQYELQKTVLSGPQRVIDNDQVVKVSFEMSWLDPSQPIHYQVGYEHAEGDIVYYQPWARTDIQ